MSVWNLPSALREFTFRRIAAPGLEVVQYQATRTTERAHIQFAHNAVVLLRNGSKEVFTPHQTLTLKEGEGFFIKKGHYLMTERPANDMVYESLMLFFDDATAHALGAALLGEARPPQAPPPEVGTLPASAPLESFAQSLKTYLTSDLPTHNSDVLLRLKLQELFWILAADPAMGFGNFLAHLHLPQQRSLEQLVEQHYKENLSLAQLAFLGGFSLSTFKRRFEEHYRMPPRKWLRARRLQEAQRLLQTTDKNVSEVCLEVGFENVSHFVQAFKEAFGHTPKQFQAQAPSP
ncbi:AraC-type DNA-binding protein [Catalinimonas alkaloidigena]|uniref:AraC-type DNA-binding protein n=1 Tax=Catalinimonas alkaloidigena TaxID=1075417 RepID=A0A1G9G9J0_9BACT|nr:AraC family transcriptional regulator [Catalinimonas alkaloidigena]SDK97378.1 AraC-type DNA-binding protein [Catalinimonas alkaloidigena]